MKSRNRGPEALLNTADADVRFAEKPNHPSLATASGSDRSVGTLHSPDSSSGLSGRCRRRPADAPRELARIRAAASAAVTSPSFLCARQNSRAEPAPARRLCVQSFNFMALIALRRGGRLWARERRMREETKRRKEKKANARWWERNGASRSMQRAGEGRGWGTAGRRPTDEGEACAVGRESTGDGEACAVGRESTGDQEPRGTLWKPEQPGG